MSGFMNNKTNVYVRVNVFDSDESFDDILSSFILINPDLNELNKLQKLIDKRFDSDWWEKEYGGDYFVDDYIKEHFNCLDISETVEMSW